MKKWHLAVLVFVMTVMLQSLGAAEEKLYCTDKVRGYDKGDFVVMAGDDVNLRLQPENGRIIRVLSRHTLLRVLDKEQDWYKVLADRTEGYVYAPFTEACRKDMLTEEDFALGYVSLNNKFDQEKVEQSMGKCLNKEKKDGRYYYTFNNLVIGVHKRKKNIVYYRISDPRIITMRGISVGDDSARAIGQYGTPDTVVYNQDGVCYEYFFKDQEDDSYRFAIEISADGIVKALIIEKMK